MGRLPSDSACLRPCFLLILRKRIHTTAIRMQAPATPPMAAPAIAPPERPGEPNELELELELLVGTGAEVFVAFEKINSERTLVLVHRTEEFEAL